MVITITNPEPKLELLPPLTAAAVSVIRTVFFNHYKTAFSVNHAATITVDFIYIAVGVDLYTGRCLCCCRLCHQLMPLLILTFPPPDSAVAFDLSTLIISNNYYVSIDHTSSIIQAKKSFSFYFYITVNYTTIRHQYLF